MPCRSAKCQATPGLASAVNVVRATLDGHQQTLNGLHPLVSDTVYFECFGGLAVVGGIGAWGQQYSISRCICSVLSRYLLHTCGLPLLPQTNEQYCNSVQQVAYVVHLFVLGP